MFISMSKSAGVSKLAMVSFSLSKGCIFSYMSLASSSTSTYCQTGPGAILELKGNADRWNKGKREWRVSCRWMWYGQSLIIGIEREELVGRIKEGSEVTAVVLML